MCERSTVSRMEGLGKECVRGRGSKWCTGGGANDHDGSGGGRQLRQWWE